MSSSSSSASTPVLSKLGSGMPNHQLRSTIRSSHIKCVGSSKKQSNSCDRHSLTPTQPSSNQITNPSSMLSEKNLVSSRRNFEKISEQNSNSSSSNSRPQLPTQQQLPNQESPSRLPLTVHQSSWLQGCQKSRTPKESPQHSGPNSLSKILHTPHTDLGHSLMGKYERNLKTPSNEMKHLDGWSLSKSSRRKQPSKRGPSSSSKESLTTHQRTVSSESSEDRIQVLGSQNPMMNHSNFDSFERIGRSPFTMQSSRSLQECESNSLNSNGSTSITKRYELMTSALSCNASSASNLDTRKPNATPTVLYALTAPQLSTNGRPAQTRKTPARPGASTATPITPNMEQSTPRPIPQPQPKIVQGSRLSSNESTRESTMESKNSLSVLQCNVARSYHSHVELLTYFHSHEYQVLLVSEPYTVEKQSELSLDSDSNSELREMEYSKRLRLRLRALALTPNKTPNDRK